MGKLKRISDPAHLIDGHRHLVSRQAAFLRLRLELLWRTLFSVTIDGPSARSQGICPDFQTVFRNGPQFPIATPRDLDAGIFVRRRWIDVLEAHIANRHAGRQKVSVIGFECSRGSLGWPATGTSPMDAR